MKYGMCDIVRISIWKEKHFSVCKVNQWAHQFYINKGVSFKPTLVNFLKIIHWSIFEHNRVWRVQLSYHEGGPQSDICRINSPAFQVPVFDSPGWKHKSNITSNRFVWSLNILNIAIIKYSKYKFNIGGLSAAPLKFHRFSICIFTPVSWS